MTYKSFKISIVVLIATAFIACDKFAAGSYPYAEKYDINTSEKTLITAIENFKRHHPEFIVPDAIIIKGNPTTLKDGRRKTDDYWYHIYFYYNDTNQIVKSWLRPLDSTNTAFAFIGINQGLEIGNWKEINHDLKGKENRVEKEKFERLILNGVKKELAKLTK